MLEEGFRRSFTTPVSDRPRRKQDRRTESFAGALPERPWPDLVNEPDTDWSLPANAAWAESIVGRTADEFAGLIVPAVIADREVVGPETDFCRDSSRPAATLCRHALAGDAEVEEAVACAAADPDGWRQLAHDARSEILGRVAVELRRARAELLRVALLDGGKLLTEADPEVSEAIDFVEFYRAAARPFRELAGTRATPVGVVVVVSPWNFPLAIPCGGIAAALAAGNTVILKPASDAVLAAWEVCQCFWRAGVSRKTLQFLPCRGSGPGARLVSHPDVAAVILTGGTETALAMLAAAPDMRLSAETGGKNATIVTAMSDRELAIRHVVQAAFSHGGQKCSATSLLLLEAEVHDDPAFRRMLCDAVESLHVDSAHVLHARVGPLIRPPSGDLARALTTLEPGESWAVAPRPSPANPALWSPGVKWGVRPGSFTHRTELFGPVLAVMRYERLAEAIEIVNATGYGLTSGIHSLDDREITEWRAGIRAGNLYVNRGTTGAIVLRQPFGGLGRSCVGPGLKAGGPNYVAAFMDFSDAPPSGMSGAIESVDLEALAARLPDDADGGRLRAALADYDRAWREEFSREHDHVRLLGQDNVRRYLPFPDVRVRIVPADTWFDAVARVAAARVTGARVVASFAPGCPPAWHQWLDAVTDPWAAGIELIDEPDAALAASLAGPHDLRIRYAGRDRVPAEVRRAAAASGRWIADGPVVSAGRVELLWYLREQTISTDYHRYGNLGRRAGESRRPVA
jgi:RHH-type proline utilization regulon transcriptional repressor/proline dehydrogenase/delta 1-pyrroline-5-carboxylate dehydrogenase